MRAEAAMEGRAYQAAKESMELLRIFRGGIAEAMERAS